MSKNQWVWSWVKQLRMRNNKMANRCTQKKWFKCLKSMMIRMKRRRKRMTEWAQGSQRLQQSAAQHSISLPLLFPGGKPLPEDAMLQWGREGEQWWRWTPYFLSLILSFRAPWSVLTRRGAEADAGLTGLSTPSRCLRTYPHPLSEVTQGFEGKGSVWICGGL